jgi:hypothetical protein
MITTSLSIVGVGLVGSNLAISLANKNLIKEIHLYDYSLTNKENYFPFVDVPKGIKKVDIVAYNILKVDNKFKVFCHYDIIKNRINDNLVIDCRDHKKPNIYADLRISSDSHSLILDSRKNNVNEHSHPFYYSKTDCFKWIQCQMPYIISYLEEKKYQDNVRILHDFKDNIVLKI